MKCIWGWMTEMGYSFRTASTLFHTSSTVLAGEEWLACLSATQDQMFSMGNRFRDLTGQGNNRIPCVSREVKARRAIRLVALHYLVGGWNLASLEDKAQQLDIRRQKCTYMLSNYRRSELDMCESYTQWLPKPSHQVQDSFVDI
ncbi:hypothetical protein HNY73_021416 [Argiope bruennichi]|uniref:Uncharacterized protein n=1 Tax=Argiope bruennichi TaxID=94029 RepID=A0A8T0DXK7_ARGBR|nr:hypothetical protein HNY73_021416 [Argiope bruennichi]